MDIGQRLRLKVAKLVSRFFSFLVGQDSCKIVQNSTKKHILFQGNSENLLRRLTCVALVIQENVSTWDLNRVDYVSEYSSHRSVFGYYGNLMDYVLP